MKKLFLALLVAAGAVLCVTSSPAFAQDMTGYCSVPPFVSRQGPPLVTIVMGKDHKLYNAAYNDASDLDNDGVLESGYKHSIDYYGYFDPYKCYVYNTTDARFNPTRVTTTKYCGNTNEWSGNFLNWLSMSRMDALRKVLYGGHRSTDTATTGTGQGVTVLEGVYIPQNATSWGKEYAGSDTRNLTPFSQPTSGNRHLFCVTSTAADAPHRIRVTQNVSNRVWEWASSNLAVCSGPETPSSYRHWTSPTNSYTVTDYMVRVKVCDSSIGLESNCKAYYNSSHNWYTYKPDGILQKYGLGDGSKVCSKTFIDCTTDSSVCNPTTTNGTCTGIAKMYFSLITGSYAKNLSGGVLRKNMRDMSDEINTTTGQFIGAYTDTDGAIIPTIDTLQTVGFNYSNFSYDGTYPGGSYVCSNKDPMSSGPIQQGECRMWGNPIAEMMYEGLRYLADKGSATSAFDQSSPDTGLNFAHPSWSTPLLTYPPCSKPNLLVISDVNTSYDSDQLPGSSFGSLPGGLAGLNVTTLADTIGTQEGIGTTPVFIGQSGSTYDQICSAKNITGLGEIRGQCPEEPTKGGSYYAAALGYYGKTQFHDNLSKPNVTTYGVALAHAAPDMKMQVGSNAITIIPTGKMVSGCNDTSTAKWRIWPYCGQKNRTDYPQYSGKCDLTYTTDRGLQIQNCSSDAYCPTSQIVTYYVDGTPTSTHGKFRISFEDAEQGSDYDMDAIATYEYTVSGNTVTVTLTDVSANGCVDLALGFFISGTGTSADGLYLPIRNNITPDARFTPAVVVGMPQTWTKTFTVSAGGSSATLLKDPLWYAAKYGGFDDINGNNLPDDPKEWARNDGVNPDTYFYVENPLNLEVQLNKAIGEILRRVSSGTAVSVLSTSAAGEGSLFQAYFNPSLFTVVGGKTQEITWTGYLNALWVDQYGNLREDDGDKKLVLTQDPIIQFDLDAVTGDTIVRKYRDTNGDGVADTLLGTYSLTDLKPIWEAGKALAQMNASDRNISTFINGDGVHNQPSGSEWSINNFTTANAHNFRPYLNAASDAEAANIIQFIREGTFSGCQRERRVDGSNYWRLGDIVNSTPTVVGMPMDQYHLIYGDTSYLEFFRDKKARKTVIYVGANDGMLHAFSAGTYHAGDDPATSTITERGWYDGDIGKELWAYIPYNLLPYLKWLADPGYCHLYYVDLKAKLVDARIFTEGDDHPNGWGTVLIGAMRLGGKPLTITNFNGGSNRTFRSAYFAIDVTNPDTPKLLWEFTDDALVSSDTYFTTSYPAVARVGAKDAVGSWYVIFGTGPTTSDGDGATTGHVYVLDLKTGGEVQQRRYDINVGGNPIFMASPITIDLGLDYGVDVAYIGASYKDLTDSQWKGKIYRLDIRNKTFDQWPTALSTVISFNQPITVAPVAALDPSNRLWFFWGTGRFFSNTDKTSTTVQTLYGVWDPGAWDSSTTAIATAQLNDVTNIRVATGGGVDTNYDGISDTTFQNYLADKRAQYSAATGRKYGWYLTMTSPIGINGERVISTPTLLGNIVLFPTFKPEGDICQYGGNSYLYALYYETGTANEAAVIGPGPGTITVSGTAKQEIARKQYLGKGMPTSVVVHAGRENGVKGMVQLGTGVVTQINITTAESPQSKVIFWREQVE
jgi:type IV pilus assembly protein PilY1